METSPRDLLQMMARNFGWLNKSCCSVGANELSLVQSEVLYEINRQHHPSIQQIADGLGMDITTLSRQIQTLEKKKLVQKTPLPKDKRVYIVSLTTEGRFVAGAIDQTVNDYLNNVFSLMNDFERDTVIRSLKLLNDSMIKARTLYPLDRC